MTVRTSLVMPLYNGSSTVERAIRSVMNQAQDDWELLVVDDCSTSMTAGKLSGRLICRVRLQSDPASRADHERWSSAARNAGINAAEGEFVGFLDCDDELLPDYLSVMEANMSDDVDIVVAAHVARNPSGRQSVRPDAAQGLFTGLETVDAALQGKLWNFLHAKVYRRALFENFGFPDDLERYEDLVFNAIAYSYSRQVRIVSQPVYVYHVQSRSLTWSQEPSMQFIRGPIDHIRAGLNPAVTGRVKQRSWNTLKAFLGVLTISGGLFASSPKASVDRIVRYVREELSFRLLADVAFAAPHIGLSGMLIKVFPRLYASLYLWHVRRTFDMGK